VQVARDCGLWRGPSYLLQHLVEIRREGVQYLGAQGLCNLIHMVEQLGGSTLGILLQAYQTGVEGAQLLVGAQGGLVGRLQL